MNLYLISNIITCVCAFIGFIFGVIRFLIPRKALYAQMITFAVGCTAFGRLYQIVRLVTGGNIPGDRQSYLLETLRTLKKGGSFAIHDTFSESKYGDMQAFVKKLKDMGYTEVRLISTTDGMFMNKSESGWMGLSNSALLTGIK